MTRPIGALVYLVNDGETDKHAVCSVLENIVQHSLRPRPRVQKMDARRH